MKHHPIQGALLGDEPYVRYWVNQCAQHNRNIHGFTYACTKAGHEGIDLTLFATIRDRQEDLDQAVLAIKANRNVATSMILLVPQTWLIPNEPQLSTGLKPVITQQSY